MPRPARFTRDDWAAAALALLAEGGPAAVAVEPAAARLGASKSSFYWLFPNRQALLEAALLTWEQQQTDAVLARFVVKVLEDESAGEKRLTPEQFKKLVAEVKAETGARGKELFHPIRIAITGSHSGPDFDKLIPILEEGSRLPMPTHVLSVRERVEEFGKARGK